MDQPAHPIQERILDKGGGTLQGHDQAENMAGARAGRERQQGEGDGGEQGGGEEE